MAKFLAVFRMKVKSEPKISKVPSFKMSYHLNMSQLEIQHENIDFHVDNGMIKMRYTSTF